MGSDKITIGAVSRVGCDATLSVCATRVTSHSLQFDVSKCTRRKHLVDKFGCNFITLFLIFVVFIHGYIICMHIRNQHIILYACHIEFLPNSAKKPSKIIAV